jgi:hypothetical protein
MGARRLYKTTSPYSHTVVKDLDTTQTADVLYAAHLDYAVRKLIRYGHTDWRWETVEFGPTIDPPSGLGGGASSPNMTGYVATDYKYVVTAVKDTPPVQESRQSAMLTITNDLTLSGNYNFLVLPAPSGDVARHIIYKEQGGVYGYIGATEGTTFVDKQLQPILSETPPQGDNPWTTTNQYPGALTFHQQRLIGGATREIINGIWGSRSADPENMDRARPARADDAFALALVAEKVNAVTHLISLDELMVFTTDGIFAIGGNADGVLTPADALPKRQSGRGARKVKPVVVEDIAFFIPSRATGLRAMGFTFEIEGYKSNNVSVFAPHLFEGYSISRIVYQEAPHSCVWLLRSDFKLLCFTWEAEQEVWGFSVIETDGQIEDIEVIPEGGYDRLYALIRRTINGTSRLFIERLALPHEEIEEACHLDCSITQVFTTPQSVITGLWHLEGATVWATFDGYAARDLVVTNGQIELPNSATGSIVTVGLQYSGEVITLPPILMLQSGTAHVNQQQIADVVVRTIDTRGIEIGVVGGDFLEQVEPQSGDDATELLNVAAKDYRVPAPGDWKTTSGVVIQQNVPLPAHIAGIFTDVRVGSE